jgi:hypothetical protein
MLNLSIQRMGASRLARFQSGSPWRLAGGIRRRFGRLQDVPAETHHERPRAAVRTIRRRCILGSDYVRDSIVVEVTSDCRRSDYREVIVSIPSICNCHLWRGSRCFNRHANLNVIRITALDINVERGIDICRDASHYPYSVQVASIAPHRFLNLFNRNKHERTS